MGSFLLQGTGSEGRCGNALLRLGTDILNRIVHSTALLQEGLSLLQSRETLVQFCLDLATLCIGEDSRHAEVILTAEVLNLTLTLHYQTDSHTLHTTGTQSGLNLTPQHGAELKAYDTVQYTTGLLGINQIQIYLTGIFYSLQDGRLGNLMKYNTTCILGSQT